MGPQDILDLLLRWEAPRKPIKIEIIVDDLSHKTLLLAQHFRWMVMCMIGGAKLEPPRLYICSPQRGCMAFQLPHFLNKRNL